MKNANIPLFPSGFLTKSMKTDCVRISLFFSTYVAFPSGTSYDIMAFEICKFPWCCSSVLWPLPIYWMWIVHHINANLQSIREALCCVVPKIVQFWFFCHVSAPSPLQSSVQYLHVIFMWVSSLNVPPRTPADPRQTILLTHSVPKVTIFKTLGIVREEKHDSLGLWTWSLGCNLQSWSLPLSLTKRHVLLNILFQVSFLLNAKSKMKDLT